jgi:hypothetical protein
MGRRGIHTAFRWESEKEIDHWEDLCRCRCEDNIKMYLIEIEWGVVDWINLVQDKDQWSALVYTVMNIRVP